MHSVLKPNIINEKEYQAKFSQAQLKDMLIFSWYPIVISRFFFEFEL